MPPSSLLARRFRRAPRGSRASWWIGKGRASGAPGSCRFPTRPRRRSSRARSAATWEVWNLHAGGPQKHAARRALADAEGPAIAELAQHSPAHLTEDLRDLRIGADAVSWYRTEIHRYGEMIREALRARAIVEATTHWDDPARVAKASENLGEGMKGIEAAKLVEAELLQTRGW